MTSLPHITIPPSSPRPQLVSETPMVLHTRVVAGSGGGPDKTILRSAHYANADRLRMAAAYIHPRHDPGAEQLRKRAQQMNCPLHQIFESGPLDPRTIMAMWQLCRRLGVTIWHGHDYKSNLLGLLLRPLWPMKLVTTVHGWTWETARTRLYYHIDNLCLPRYDEVIVVSPKLMAHCRDLSIPTERLTYIPNAIELDDYQREIPPGATRARYGVADNRFVLGVVGRLSSEKGVDRAIRACANLAQRYPQMELHIIGDGPQRTSLEELAQQLAIGHRVRFWGWQPRSQPFYELMDALLLPSHTEGLPNVVLEAMAMGVPVAATDVGGVRELLDDGRCGVILNKFDSSWPNELAALIASADRRTELARRARQRVEDHYSFNRRMTKVFAVYDRVLGRTSVPSQQRRAA